MPRVDAVFYQEAGEDVPVLDWLKQLRGTDQQAYAKCIAAIERLAEFGHELRRPLSDFLRDGIHELRVRKGRVNYRILYFFHGRNLVVLAHAITKGGKCQMPLSTEPFGEGMPSRLIRRRTLIWMRKHKP